MLAAARVPSNFLPACRTNFDCDNLEQFLANLGGGSRFKGKMEKGKENPYSCLVLAGLCAMLYACCQACCRAACLPCPGRSGLLRSVDSLANTQQCCLSSACLLIDAYKVPCHACCTAACLPRAVSCSLLRCVGSSKYAAMLFLHTGSLAIAYKVALLTRKPAARLLACNVLAGVLLHACNMLAGVCCSALLSSLILTYPREAPSGAPLA